ncbi:MAG: hypothetical protein PHU71_00005 [Candidatus Gracilibacteria bacterium]|nr:hypothetical protein [Candidatus Gracilibacteria bacterium]
MQKNKENLHRELREVISSQKEWLTLISIIDLLDVGEQRRFIKELLEISGISEEEYHNAQDRYKRILGKFAQIHGQHGEFHRAAVLYETLGDFIEAAINYKQHARQHREDAEKAQGSLAPSQTLLESDKKRGLGTAEEIKAAMRESYAKAADTYKKAVAMYEKAGDRIEQAKMCREVAQSLKRVEDWEQAAQYYEMAADIFESCNIGSWADGCRSAAASLRARAESLNRDKVASP